MEHAVAPMPGASATRRPVVRASTLVVLLLLLLPSCITTLMWNGDWQMQRDMYHGGAACVLISEGAPLRLFVAVDTEVAAVLGTATDSVTSWIELIPEDGADLVALLRHQPSGTSDVLFDVRFWPRTGEERRADIWLRVTIDDDLERTGIVDARSSRQSRRVMTAGAACTWSGPKEPPPAGADLPAPTITVLLQRRVGLGTTEMVLFTPLTLACDAVLLPFELLLFVAMRLAH